MLSRFVNYIKIWLSLPARIAKIEKQLADERLNREETDWIKRQHFTQKAAAGELLDYTQKLITGEIVADPSEKANIDFNTAWGGLFADSNDLYSAEKAGFGPEGQWIPSLDDQLQRLQGAFGVRKERTTKIVDDAMKLAGAFPKEMPSEGAQNG